VYHFRLAGSFKLFKGQVQSFAHLRNCWGPKRANP
jgi:hypothetical protein